MLCLPRDLNSCYAEYFPTVSTLNSLLCQDHLLSITPLTQKCYFWRPEQCHTDFLPQCLPACHFKPNSWVKFYRLKELSPSDLISDHAESLQTVTTKPVCHFNTISWDNSNDSVLGGPWWWLLISLPSATVKWPAFQDHILYKTRTTQKSSVLGNLNNVLCSLSLPMSSLSGLLKPHSLKFKWLIWSTFNDLTSFLTTHFSSSWPYLFHIFSHALSWMLRCLWILWFIILYQEF